MSHLKDPYKIFLVGQVTFSKGDLHDMERSCKGYLFKFTKSLMTHHLIFFFFFRNFIYPGNYNLAKGHFSLHPSCT